MNFSTSAFTGGNTTTTAPSAGDGAVQVTGLQITQNAATQTWRLSFSMSDAGHIAYVAIKDGDGYATTWGGVFPMTPFDNTDAMDWCPMLFPAGLVSWVGINFPRSYHYYGGYRHEVGPLVPTVGYNVSSGNGTGATYNPYSDLSAAGGAPVISASIVNAAGKLMSRPVEVWYVRRDGAAPLEAGPCGTLVDFLQAFQRAPGNSVPDAAYIEYISLGFGASNRCAYWLPFDAFPSYT